MDKFLERDLPWVSNKMAAAPEYDLVDVEKFKFKKSQNILIKGNQNHHSVRRSKFY